MVVFAEVPHPVFSEFVIFSLTVGGGAKLIEASLSARTLIVLTPYLNIFSLYTTLIKLMYAQLAMYA